MTADETPSSLAGSSKYSNDYRQYPPPSSQPKAFCEWLRNLTRTEKIDWVFPTTEISSQLILLNSDCLNSARIPFASLEQVMSLADKWQLIQLAKRLGITHPATRYYTCAHELSADIMTALHYPVVLKPTQSRRWLGDRWLSTSVHVAYSSNELTTLLQSHEYLRDFPFMLQEFIEGHGAGIFALYDHGKPLAFFAHQRLREKPPRGGVSVLSRSAPLNPELLKIATQLLDAANWHGVAMIEFKIAADGTPYLMEVNTRFWGSLQLAIDAGIDFPSLLLQSCLKLPIRAPENYRIDQKLRWVLGDFDSLYLVLKDAEFTTKEKIKRVFDFVTPHPFTTHHEVNRLHDLGPAWHELKSYIDNIIR
ncbi:MAG: ATP-grasp domain-containing protein [Spongiibacteraceae bacterium]